MIKPTPAQEVALDLLLTLQRRVLYHGGGTRISQETLIMGLAETLGDLIELTPITTRGSNLRLVQKMIASRVTKMEGMQ